MATESTQSDPTQNPSSDYYLHPSYHASTKLVYVPFDGIGYADWKRSMIIGLTAINKMCFVDGSLEIQAQILMRLKHGNAVTI